MNNNQTQGGLASQLVGWLNHPFNSNGSAFNWVLFLGLFTITAFFWQTVLIKIREI